MTPFAIHSGQNNMSAAADVKVYRNFTQAQLDAAYNNRAVATDYDTVRAARIERSNALYAASRCTRDLAYGAGPRQRLDFFHARTPGRPTLAYIHGGYWQTNDKEPNAFIAEGPLAHGINVALLEYTLAPQAGMSAIVDEIAAAVAWLLARLDTELGAGGPLIVSGHSAGGHLAAMAARLPGVAAALPISGLFDLEPIRLSYLNAPIKMDAVEARAQSPMGLSLPAVPVSVSVGGAELPELVRQSSDYFAALHKSGNAGMELVLAGENHFSILEQLARPGGALCAEVARLAEA